MRAYPIVHAALVHIFEHAKRDADLRRPQERREEWIFIARFLNSCHILLPFLPTTLD